MANAIENYVYGTFARGAARRNKVFNLTIDQLLSIVSQPCVYCGTMHSNYATRNRKAGPITLAYNSVDCVDPTAGYSVDNCVSCCKYCNAAKTDQDVDTFKASAWLAQRIADVRG
jgi:hypothetical protein